MKKLMLAALLSLPMAAFAAKKPMPLSAGTARCWLTR
jgi:hypothetical protein